MENFHAECEINQGLFDIAWLATVDGQNVIDTEHFSFLESH